MNNMVRLLVILAALLTVLLSTGCNIAGGVAYIVGGPPKIDAEYPLADRPTVVFVDDRGNTISTSNARSIRLEIADVVSRELMVKKVLTETISPRDALSAALARDRHGDLMPMDAIGRDVGAEQIIYVEMLAFTDRPDGATPRPTAICRVRVLDVTEQRRLYPAPDSQQSARALQSSMGEIDDALLRSPSSRLKIHLALAEKTGDQIAKLFYKHEAKELGGSLQTR